MTKLVERVRHRTFDGLLVYVSRVAGPTRSLRWHSMAVSPRNLPPSYDADRVGVRRSDVVRPTERVTKIELVGLAGVGKSHLARRLVAWFGGRAAEHSEVSPTWRDLPELPRTLADLAPVLRMVMRSGGASWGVRVRFCQRLVVHAWRDAAVERSLRGRNVVIIEEGWFHKLRQLRRITRTETTFAELAGRLGRRRVEADLVVLLTADATEICARKLRRKGRPVTPETLARQYAKSAALGQWDEYARTRLDLEQAAARFQQRFVEIDYGATFDFERDLVPHLPSLEAMTHDGA
jgi:hypothetical protein